MVDTIMEFAEKEVSQAYSLFWSMHQYDPRNNNESLYVRRWKKVNEHIKVTYTESTQHDKPDSVEMFYLIKDIFSNQSTRAQIIWVQYYSKDEMKDNSHKWELMGLYNGIALAAIKRRFAHKDPKKITYYVETPGLSKISTGTINTVCTTLLEAKTIGEGRIKKYIDRLNEFQQGLGYGCVGED